MAGCYITSTGSFLPGNPVDNQSINQYLGKVMGERRVRQKILAASGIEEFEKAKNLYNGMCLSAIKSGGTFAAEHGVGKNKKALLYEMYDEQVMNEMFRIKKTLDPNLILCGGNIFKTES